MRIILYAEERQANHAYESGAILAKELASQTGVIVSVVIVSSMEIITEAPEGTNESDVDRSYMHGTLEHGETAVYGLKGPPTVSPLPPPFLTCPI